MQRTKLLIVDDHPLFRHGLMEVLEAEEAFDIVGEASDGNEAVDKALALRPDVVIMDLYMPNCDGIEATRRLQNEMPETKVLILTVSGREEDLFRAMHSGARGYMVKNEKPELLVQAIQKIANGGTASSVLGGLKAGQPRVAEPPLSPREQEVLPLLAQNATDRAIAFRLSTTEIA
ncbi:response regulator, partial [Chloroflexota bacterium]